MAFKGLQVEAQAWGVCGLVVEGSLRSLGVQKRWTWGGQVWEHRGNRVGGVRKDSIGEGGGDVVEERREMGVGE